MPEGIPDKLFLTDEEARNAMGVGETVFGHLVKDNAHWLRPVYHGTGKKLTKRWKRQDIIVLAHIWGNMLHPAQQADASKNSETATED